MKQDFPVILIFILFGIALYLLYLMLSF